MYPVLGDKLYTYSVDNLSGGIVFDRSDSKLKDNQSPDMLNMYFDGISLKKRDGIREILKEENIISCYFKKYYNYFIYHAKDKLIAFDTLNKNRIVLHTMINEIKGTFFLYNGYVYYVGTGEYYKISFEEDKLLCETVEGYIPTVMINCNPKSIGDDNEYYNYLTDKFKFTYNTDENQKTIEMPEVSLDREVAPVIYFENKQIKDFTVDFEKRTITFNSSLYSGHNALEITYKRNDLSKDREKITFCKISESFGGICAGISEGTRVFMAGNEKFPSTFFYSELKNPEYFPVNQFEILGDDGEEIMCMGKQYNGLVFLKKNSVYISYYEFSGDEINFTVSRLNGNIGCDCRDTLETVDNQLVWLNSKWGVMTLSSTNIKDEKNIRCISLNINGHTSKKALLMQEDLSDSVAFIEGGKLYIVTKKYTYVLNISYNFYIGKNSGDFSWFLMDNINASGYIKDGKKGYFVNHKGIFQFDKVLYDVDINTPINSYVTTKAIDFGAPHYFKNVYDMSFSLKSMNNSYFKVEIFDENGKLKKANEYTVNRFNFSNFGFNEFTFKQNMFAFVFKRRITRRRTKYLMVKFSNNSNNSQMNLSDIYITYSIERSARFNGI